jgi:hypothetical protein
VRSPRVSSFPGRLLAGALTLGATPVLAGPDSEVPSAADPGDPIDLHLSLEYEYGSEHAAITRERAGLPGTDPSDPVPELDDLTSSRSVHVLTPRAALGVFRDTWVSLALPITLADRRTLGFADGVDASSSTTIEDGLLTPDGFDADDPGTPLPASVGVFRGPSRSGLDQLHLGAGFAPMNQRRDDTKPTWKLGAEFRIAIGKPARWSETSPGSDDGVGRGVHEVRLWTTMARRLGRFEPYVGLEWLAPMAVTGSSPFADPGFGARRSMPQMHGRARGGFEFIPVERPKDDVKVSLDIGATLDAAFEGRAYSPMWEVFAHAGAVGSDGPLVLDGDPTAAGIQDLANPGVTQVENSLRTDLHLAVRAELGRNVHIAAGLAWGRTTGHVISFADAGVDRPTCDAGQTSGCETDGNELVTPGTSEVNPLYVERIDLVGHRYRAEALSSMQAMVTGTMLF